MEYLNDPSIIEEFLDVSEEIGLNETIETENGNIEYTSEYKQEAVGSQSGFLTMASSFKATYTKSQTMFDVKITSLSTYVLYERNNTGTPTKTTGRGQFHSNVNPGASVSNSGGNHWMSSGAAKANTDWIFTFARYSPLQWSKQQTVVRTKNATTGSLTKSY